MGDRTRFVLLSILVSSVVSGVVPGFSAPSSGAKSNTRKSNQAPGQYDENSNSTKNSRFQALKKMGSPLGPSCKGSGSDKMCLALKYVVYKDYDSNEAVSQSNAVQNIQQMNQVWGQCGISFQIDKYLAVLPQDYALQYQTANYDELTQIRQDFEDDSTLLVVTTGPWDRTGSLGSSGANAWTSMPGEEPLGVVLERPVGTYPNIIAHELGHYLSLPHYGDSSDLMNPIIYDNSTHLYEDQCEAARSAAISYWQRMLR